MRKVLNILAIATVVVAGGVSLASAQEPLDIRGPYCSMKNPAERGELLLCHQRGRGLL